MNKELVTFNSCVAVIGTVLAQVLGGWDTALQVLVSMVVLDYATGVMIAIIQKNLSSDVGFRGLFKKMMIFALVYVAVLVDQATNSDIIRTLTIMFYIANEGISVLENATKLGVPFPQALIFYYKGRPIRNNAIVISSKSHQTGLIFKGSKQNSIIRK